MNESVVSDQNKFIWSYLKKEKYLKNGLNNKI